MFRRRRAEPLAAATSPAPVLAPDSAGESPRVEVLDRPDGHAPLPAPAATRDDDALVRASQAGDLEAFNLLVLRHERPVFNVALRLLRDVGLAEDATQDTFIRAWQNIRTFQTGSVRSWLYKIATNRSYDMLRASARRPAEPSARHRWIEVSGSRLATWREGRGAWSRLPWCRNIAASPIDAALPPPHSAAA